MTKIAVYHRDIGTACYTGSFVFDVERLPEILLGTPLEWCWKSDRCAPDDRLLSRPLTVLTPDTAGCFRDDLLEYLVPFLVRHILAVGSDQGSLDVADPEAVRSALEAFASREDGPVRVVIRRHPNEGWFVDAPHTPTNPVRKLLEALGVSDGTIAERRRYPRPYGGETFLEGECRVLGPFWPRVESCGTGTP